MPPARKVRAQNRPRPHTRLQSSPAGLAARQAPQSLGTHQPANLRPLPPGQVFRSAPPPWSQTSWARSQAVHPPPAAPLGGGHATGPVGPLSFHHPAPVRQSLADPVLQPVPGVWTPVRPACTLDTETTGIFAANTSTSSSRRCSRPDNSTLDAHTTTHRKRLRRRDEDSADIHTSALPGQARTACPPEGIDFSAGSIASDSDQSLCAEPTACYPVSSASTFHRNAASLSPPPRPLRQQPKGAVPWSLRTSADLAWDPWPDPLSSLGTSLAHLGLFGKLTHLRQAACGLVQKCANPASCLSSTENFAEPKCLRGDHLSDHPASVALSDLADELETERQRIEERLFDSFFDYALYADAPGTSQIAEDERTPSTSIWGAFSGSLGLTPAPSSDPPDTFWVGAEGSSPPALASSGMVQPQDVDLSPIMPIKLPAIISHHGLLTPPPSPPTFEDSPSGPSEGGGLSGLLVSVDSTWQHA